MNLFGIGGFELIIIFLIGLFVVGPDKLLILKSIIPFVCYKIIYFHSSSNSKNLLKYFRKKFRIFCSQTKLKIVMEYSL